MLVYKINIYPTKNVIAFKFFDLPAGTPDYVLCKYLYIIRNPTNGTHHFCRWSGLNEIKWVLLLWPGWFNIIVVYTIIIRHTHSYKIILTSSPVGLQSWHLFFVGVLYLTIVQRHYCYQYFSNKIITKRLFRLKPLAPVL